MLVRIPISWLMTRFAYLNIGWRIDLVRGWSGKDHPHWPKPMMYQWEPRLRFGLSDYPIGWEGDFFGDEP